MFVKHASKPLRGSFQPHFNPNPTVLLQIRVNTSNTKQDPIATTGRNSEPAERPAMAEHGVNNGIKLHEG